MNGNTVFFGVAFVIIAAVIAAKAAKFFRGEFDNSRTFEGATYNGNWQHTFSIVALVLLVVGVILYVVLS